MPAYRPLLTGTATLLAAVSLAACSSSGPSTSSTSTPAAGSSATTAPAATSGTTVTASLTEFHIALSSSTLKPGTYTFKVKNAGSITHALTVDGPGVADKTTGDLDPGASATLTVALTSGKYDVFCPVGDHKMEGMDTTVQVG